MRGLLADHNADGHLAVLLAVFSRPGWRDLWEALQLSAFRFSDLGLVDTMADDVLWDYCQRAELVLLTNNRNGAGDDSLEFAIRTKNSESSLPVLTCANPLRVLRDRRYAELVAAKVLEILQDIDTLRGAGRLFLP